MRIGGRQDLDSDWREGEGARRVGTSLNPRDAGEATYHSWRMLMHWNEEKWGPAGALLMLHTVG